MLDEKAGRYCPKRTLRNFHRGRSTAITEDLASEYGDIRRQISENQLPRVGRCCVRLDSRLRKGAKCSIDLGKCFIGYAASLPFSSQLLACWLRFGASSEFRPLALPYSAFFLGC